MKNFAIICFIVLLSSCNRKNDVCHVTSLINNEHKIRIDIDECRIEKSIKMSDLFDDFLVIPFVSNDENLLGDVTQVEIFNDTIFVLDGTISRSLFLFSIEGNFIRRIGQTGRGPGEYIEPNCFTIDKKHRNVYILDKPSGKVNKYDFYGNYISGVKTEGPCLSIMSRDGYLYFDRAPKIKDNSYLLYSIDNDYNPVNRWLDFPLTNMGYIGNFNLNRISFSSNKSNTLYTKQFTNTLYKINNDGVTPYLSVQSKNSFIEKDISELHSILNNRTIPRHEILRSFKTEKFWGIMNVYNTEKFALMNSRYNGRHLYICYSYSTNTTNIFQYFKDDLTYNRFPSFITSTHDKMISIVKKDYSGRYEELLYNINSKKIITTDKVRKVLNKNSLGNPIMIIYKCKM